MHDPGVGGMGDFYILDVRLCRRARNCDQTGQFNGVGEARKDERPTATVSDWEPVTSESVPDVGATENGKQTQNLQKISDLRPKIHPQDIRWCVVAAPRLRQDLVRLVLMWDFSTTKYCSHTAVVAMAFAENDDKRPCLAWQTQ